MVSLIQHQRNQVANSLENALLKCEWCAGAPEKTTAGKRTSQARQQPMKRENPTRPDF